VLFSGRWPPHHPTPPPPTPPAMYTHPPPLPLGTTHTRPHAHAPFGLDGLPAPRQRAPRGLWPHTHPTPTHPTFPHRAPAASPRPCPHFLPCTYLRWFVPHALRLGFQVWATYSLLSSISQQAEKGYCTTTSHYSRTVPPPTALHILDFSYPTHTVLLCISWLGQVDRHAFSSFLPACPHTLQPHLTWEATLPYLLKHCTLLSLQNCAHTHCTPTPACPFSKQASGLTSSACLNKWCIRP